MSSAMNLIITMGILAGGVILFMNRCPWLGVCGDLFPNANAQTPPVTTDTSAPAASTADTTATTKEKKHKKKKHSSSSSDDQEDKPSPSSGFGSIQSAAEAIRGSTTGTEQQKNDFYCAGDYCKTYPNLCPHCKDGKFVGYTHAFNSYDIASMMRRRGIRPYRAFNGRLAI